MQNPTGGPRERSGSRSETAAARFLIVASWGRNQSDRVSGLLGSDASVVCYLDSLEESISTAAQSGKPETEGTGGEEGLVA